MRSPGRLPRRVNAQALAHVPLTHRHLRWLIHFEGLTGPRSCGPGVEDLGVEVAQCWWLRSHIAARRAEVEACEVSPRGQAWMSDKSVGG